MRILIFILSGIWFSCANSKGEGDVRMLEPLKQEACDTSRSHANLLDSLDHAHDEIIDASGEEITKLTIGEDSVLHLRANMNKDHRIFGYTAPDSKSKRLLLISIFTDDVKGNPFNCPLGAYYESLGMKDLTLILKSKDKDFYEVIAKKNHKTVDIVYIKNRWIEFLPD